MPERALDQLDLHEVIQGCRLEAGQPRAQETGYCFELFRRAVDEQEPAAWQAIDEQYRCLIQRWIHDCSPELPPQAVADIAPETWPRFWQALTRSSAPLTERFAHVGAILKYLKQCSLSVFWEYERRLRRREQVRQLLSTDEQVLSAQVVSEEEVLARIDRESLLQRVQEWIKAYVTDPQEQQVLSLSYQEGLSPAEIAARYPQEFADAQTVRRLKERVLKRARRALGNEPQPYLSRNGKNGAQRNGKIALARAGGVAVSQGQKESHNG
ncbi:MAG: sigma-70 family RNA polymerase sigma factor [Anaerolineae bacterium]|nr:sigma-70 family RNA polymerase sigma factor [Anaerolineae bacterium]